MTPKPSDVRVAREADAENLISLVCASETEWSLLPRSLDRVRSVVWAAVGPSLHDHAGKAIMKPTFGVIGDARRIEGAIGLFPTQPWDSESYYLRVFFHYVAPDCRKSTHGKHLMEFVKWFGDRANVPVVFELLHQERVEAKARLYARQAKNAGGLYIHHPEPV
jgi:hypothetical protein